VFTASAEEERPPAPPRDEDEAPPPPRRRRPPVEEEERFEEEEPVRRRRPAPPEDEEEDEEPPPPEDEEEEEKERRPRRRKRRGRKREAAASAVTGPAIALMVVASITIVLQILNVILALVGVGLFAAQGGQNKEPAFLIGQICGTLLGIGINGYILSAAIKMKQLNNYSYAKTGAIISLLPCTICWLGLPFGIWALVVLNRYEVKEAFR
jgi:hypothetical protein